MKIGNRVRIFAGGASALAAIRLIAIGDTIAGAIFLWNALFFLTIAIWGGR